MSNSPLNEGNAKKIAPGDYTVIRSISHSLEQLAGEINILNHEKGWWDEPRSVLECSAMVGTELAEAIEHYRVHGMSDAKDILFDPVSKKPEGIAVEMADAIIRILDWCAEYEVPVGEALYLKFLYNTTRERRHGGKLA